MAKVYRQIGQSDSSVFYCEKALDIAEKSGFIAIIIQGNNLLSELYEDHNLQKSFEYKKSAMAWTDSLNRLARKTAIQSFIEYDQQERQYEIDKNRIEYKNRLRRNAFLGSTFTLIIIAIFLFILSRRKQKAKQKIEKAYGQLKATQSPTHPIRKNGLAW